MSLPNIPNITPTISLNRAAVVNILLASIALEELGLAHILNAEGEKLQFVVEGRVSTPDIPGIFSINQSLHEMLKTVAKQEMLLEFKLEEVLQLVSTSSTTSITTTTTSTTTSSSTTTTTTTATPLLFLFGNIASATGEIESTILTDDDDAFYNANFAPVLSGYNITSTPIIGVPTIPQPSIHIVKEVSVDNGVTFQGADLPNGPTLPPGFRARFRVTVSNNGNVPLTNVTVTDPSLGLISIIPTLVNGAGVQWIAVPL